MLTKQLLGPALVALIVVSVSASAQPVPPPTTGHIHNPNPVVNRPDSIQDAGLYGYWSRMTDQDRAGGALLGKVVVKDEVLPWDPIVVTVSCNGAAVYTAETDSKGYFLILPSRIPGEASLQGDRERQMKVHFEGCAVQAFLAGFKSSGLGITEGNLRDSPELGTITLTREFTARGTAMSATSKSVPAGAAEHWNRAGEEMLAGRPDRARRQLEEAVRIDPGFAEAWYHLGALQLVSNPGEAQICLRKAAATDPAFVSPYEQLAGLAVQQEDWRGALKSLNQYLQLDPKGTSHIWYYSALSNFSLGNIDTAEGSANKLLAMDPLHNTRNGEQLLAVILARKADYSSALAHLRHCLSYTPQGPDAELLKAQIAQLEKHVPKAN
ncbi:MAG: tetratricopeptide repeat protein [Terriglobales bacterium]